MSDNEKMFKTPETRTTVKQNWMLAAGLVLVIIGIFFMVQNATNTFAIRPVLLLSAGAIFLALAIALVKNSFFFYFGIFFLLNGIVFFVADTDLSPYTIRQLWPFLVIAAGMSLWPAGLYKLKRIRTVYLFPSIALIALGVTFMLFSLKIIKTKFIVVFARYWPVLMIAAGIALVATFIWQQKHKQEFTYLADDTVGTRIDTIK